MMPGEPGCGGLYILPRTGLFLLLHLRGVFSPFLAWPAGWMDEYTVGFFLWLGGGGGV
jgi:hypothetical protein